MKRSRPCLGKDGSRRRASTPAGKTITVEVAPEQAAMTRQFGEADQLRPLAGIKVAGQRQFASSRESQELPNLSMSLQKGPGVRRPFLEHPNAADSFPLSDTEHSDAREAFQYRRLETSAEIAG